MERRLLAVIFAIVSYNFFFLSHSASHVKVGWVWLAVDLIFWLPELKSSAKAK